MAEAILAGRRLFTPSISGITRQRTWVFVEPVGRAGWSVAKVAMVAELDVYPPDWRWEVALLVSCAVALGWAGLFLGLGGPDLEHQSLRRIALGGSLLLLAGIGMLFRESLLLPEETPPYETTVMNPMALRAFEKANADLQVGLHEVPARFILTGVFVHTLEAVSTTTMRITGQIWQRYPREVPREERGVSLPEAISGDLRLDQEVVQGDSVVQIYAFRVVVASEITRADNYPFDSTRIRLRLWPKAIFRSQVLVPDLAGYTVLSPSALPGVDGEIELPGWTLLESRFAFTHEAYNANLGIADFVGQRRSPELLFTLTLQRNFLNPFVAAFLPLVAVAGLLYILLLTVTRDPERIKGTGYNYLNFLRTAVALFFSLLVAQFNVRGRLAATGVIDLEWFYFTLYGFILAVSALAMTFAQGGDGVLHDRDQDLPKLAFWPALLGIYYLIALRFLA
jgi:hypothetical protein